MKIGILSFRARSRKVSEEETGLKKAAKLLGHSAKIYRVSNFHMVYDKSSPCLIYEGKPFKKCDVMITRPSVLQNVELHISIIDQMEMTGTPLFNNYNSILCAKNKVKTMQILDGKNIPIPKTVVLQRQDDLKSAVKLLGGFPVIVKQPYGSFGNGVVIVESMRALNSFLVWDKPMYLLQQFVKYAKGRDIRIFVINGKVVGSMMRSAKKGEFRSNIELGGKGMNIEITEQEADIAIRSIEALGLEYGGVDVIRANGCPVVLEVNSNPGFKALEMATGVNIAKEIVTHAVEYASKRK
ncbi:MAG: RimK family alpha-L-glutamate ligase [Candidatus Peregrinibacteria bacterium]|nr:RimK family alpha-L-glutamate ligase [Candidatus Peregrinibacteria bacterium]